MENLVGDHIPSPEKLKSLLAKLREVRAELMKFGVVLSPDVRRRRLRMRRGALEYLPLLVSLVEKYKIEADAAPLAGLADDQRLIAALSPFEDESAGLESLISDTLLEAEHELWQAFLLYYGVLQSMAGRVPALKAELEPLAKLLAHSRSERRRPEPSPDPAPTP
jgi:hypothetical protein